MDGADASTRRFVIGEGIVGSAAARGEGEIINDCDADPRATPLETGLGAIMVAPLRAGGASRYGPITDSRAAFSSISGPRSTGSMPPMR